MCRHSKYRFSAIFNFPPPREFFPAIRMTRFDRFPYFLMTPLSFIISLQDIKGNIFPPPPPLACPSFCPRFSLFGKSVLHAVGDPLPPLLAPTAPPHQREVTGGNRSPPLPVGFDASLPADVTNNLSDSDNPELCFGFVCICFFFQHKKQTSFFFYNLGNTLFSPLLCRSWASVNRPR